MQQIYTPPPAFAGIAAVLRTVREGFGGSGPIPGTGGTGGLTRGGGGTLRVAGPAS